MGMYDEVMVVCPHCGNNIEMQSRSGKCTLHRYSSSNAPYDVLKGLEGDSFYCDSCGLSGKLTIVPVPVVKYLVAVIDKNNEINI